MTYATTSEIKKYLPPHSVDVRPLDYEWAEASNAVVFISTLDAETFTQWETELTEFYRLQVSDDCVMNVESDPDLGCISFWFQTLPNIDVHVARCKNIDSVENLNSWVGSTLLASIAADTRAATVGLIRIRPA